MIFKIGGEIALIIWGLCIVCAILAQVFPVLGMIAFLLLVAGFAVFLGSAMLELILGG